MGKVILLEAAKTDRAVTVQMAWQDYVDARDRADSSKDVTQAIAAGKAWRRFLELFDRRTA